MQQMMKRWEVSAEGRANLRLVEVPRPIPQPGEILVKVNAVALNFRDAHLIAHGMGPVLPWPFTPSSDMAGSVTSRGDGVTRFKEGDRVLSTFYPGWIDGPPLGSAGQPNFKSLGGIYPGMLTEYVALPEDWLVAAPKSLSDVEASTLPCAGLTAWVSLFEQGRLQPGQTVLVQGTGGVAIFGAQFAKARGAEVIVVSRNNEKLERAKSLKIADIGINRNEEDWVQAVYRVTANRGVDHILETIGGKSLGRSLDAIAVNGRISLIGLLEGLELSGSAGPLLLKSPVIQGIGVGSRRSLEALVEEIDRMGLQPVIGGQYGFDQLPAALDHLARGAFGKVVISLA
jgi:NADPH:quinone reductase-like Zn-dependent oxidoreductase